VPAETEAVGQHGTWDPGPFGGDHVEAEVLVDICGARGGWQDGRSASSACPAAITAS
jgi:hypothetical protein